MQYYEFSRCQNLPHIHMTSPKEKKRKKRRNNVRIKCLLEHENRLLRNTPPLAVRVLLSHALALGRLRWVTKSVLSQGHYEDIVIHPA